MGECGWHIWCVDWQGDDMADQPSVVSAPNPQTAAERWVELLDAKGQSDAMAGVSLLIEGPDGDLHRVEVAGELSVDWRTTIKEVE